MLVYSVASKKNLENAVAKAKTLKPRVKVLDFGKFEVAGSKGKTYTVTYQFNSAGELVIDCDCDGGKKGLACYHAAACSTIFKLQHSEKRAAKEAVPAPVEDDKTEIHCPNCGKWLLAWALEFHLTRGYCEAANLAAPAPAPVLAVKEFHPCPNCQRSTNFKQSPEGLCVYCHMDKGVAEARAKGWIDDHQENDFCEYGPDAAVEGRY